MEVSLTMEAAPLWVSPTHFYISTKFVRGQRVLTNLDKFVVYISTKFVRGQRVLTNLDKFVVGCQVVLPSF
jgi:hypothetical protein